VVLVVQGERPGLRAALEVAALVAAHHSRARGERTVDVRTTEVKHVRRVPGSPGLVTVAHERVVRVSLDDPRLAAILLTRQDTDTRLGG
jgi:predicted ribosome quality control (RQC) complex YloA/Tae2 family protein